MDTLSVHTLNHNGAVLLLRISKPYIVAASQQGGATVLDQSTDGNEQCHTLDLGLLWDIACLGDRLVVANRDGVVRLWNLKTREILQEYTGHTEPVRAALMPNENTIVSSTNAGAIYIWDVASGQRRYALTGHTGDITCLSIHENRLVSGGDDTNARIWDITTGECLHVLGGHESGVGIVAYNKDHSLLATGGSGGALKIWRLHEGTLLAECGQEGQKHTKIPTAFLNLNENLLSAGADGNIFEWEWNSGRQVAVVTAHSNEAIRGMVLVEGKLVTAAMDGMIKIWDENRSNVISELSSGEHSVVWTMKELDGDKVIAAVKELDDVQYLKIWKLPVFT